MNKKRHLCSFTALLLVIFTVFGVMPIGNYNTAFATLPNAGGEGYASLHEYLSPTDDPNVFKVVMSLSGFPNTPPTTEVVVAIDASSSMNETPLGNAYDSIGTTGARDDLSPGAGHYPTAAMSRLVDESFVPPAPTYGTFETLWLFPLQKQVKEITGISVPVGVQQPEAFYSTLLPSSSYGAPSDTRIYNALDAARRSVDTFLSTKTNPGANTTSLGILTFSSNDDASVEHPFGLDGPDLHKDLTIPGHTSIPTSYLDTGLIMWPSYGFGEAGQKDAGGDITYSTNIGDTRSTAANIDKIAAFNIYQSIHGGPPLPPYTPTSVAGVTSKWQVGRPLFQYIKGLQDGATVSGSGLSNAEVEDLANRGMITFDSGGTGKDLLMKDLENVFAGTSASLTNIRAGLEEANMLFGGGVGVNGGVSAPPSDPSTRRFLIFLSDMEDNDGTMVPGYDPATTFTMIDDMKAKGGIQFMVIGLNTVGAGPFNNGMDDLGYIDPAAPELTSPTSLAPGAKLVNHTPSQTPLGSGNWSTYGIWMGTKLVPSAYSIGYGNWTAVENNYGEYDNWSGETPRYKYATTNAELHTAFDEYVNSIIFFGDKAKASIEINSDVYEVTRFKTFPIFETTGTEDQKVSQSGDKISWDMNGGIPLTTINTLTFYVRIKDGANVTPGTFYPVNSSTSFTAYGPFPDPTGQFHKHPNGGWPDRWMVKEWVPSYASPSGETKDGIPADETPQTPSVVETKSSGGIMAAFTAPLYGGGLTPYTPSVTPNKNIIAAESLQEGSEETPVAATGNSSKAFLPLLGILMAGALLIATKKRKEDQ